MALASNFSSIIWI